MRVDVDPILQCARMLAPMIDPNVHSCGSVPPHGANSVQQILPETGVCSLDRSPPGSPEMMIEHADLTTVPDAAAACCQ